MGPAGEPRRSGRRAAKVPGGALDGRRPQKDESSAIVVQFRPDDASNEPRAAEDGRGIALAFAVGRALGSGCGGGGISLVAAAMFN